MPVKRRKSVKAGQAGSCVDCPPGGRRSAPYPGPRCATHHRAVNPFGATPRRSVATRRTTTQRMGITEDDYQALRRAQGGRCAWCRRATGRSKRLAIDHDHRCCPGRYSCGKCVRGLLCSTCNQTLGHFRDSPQAIERGAAYLRQPPAWGVLPGAGPPPGRQRPDLGPSRGGFGGPGPGARAG